MSKIHHCVYKKGHKMNLAERMNILSKASVDAHELEGMYARALNHIESDAKKGRLRTSHKDCWYSKEDVFNTMLTTMLKNDGFRAEWRRSVSTNEYVIDIDWSNAVAPNFLNDEEKMIDFRVLTKDEFLASYSYITEEEYDNTALLLGETL